MQLLSLNNYAKEQIVLVCSKSLVLLPRLCKLLPSFTIADYKVITSTSYTLKEIEVLHALEFKIPQKEYTERTEDNVPGQRPDTPLPCLLSRHSGFICLSV